MCAHYTWLDSLKKCTDEEFGKLVRAALKYARDGAQPSFAEGSREELLWGLLQTQLDIESAVYARKAAAGRTGGNTRWHGTSQTEAKTAATGQKEIAELKDFIKSMEGTSSK